ncbi:hypothetical protein [Burkholderia gladioli]|uniref:hypothetical protein n=1 Tax=Burkholderia gladioli TaxID=28095 RepID=UPI000FDAECCD|nr:hypothetical protein [Burkholderia gladioli]
MALKQPMDSGKQCVGREGELTHAVTHDHVLRRAIRLCSELGGHLSPLERDVVVHCQQRIGHGLSPSIARERWLLDIERTLRDRFEARVCLLVSDAGGNHEGEHPSYPRADWPHLNDDAIPAIDYWFWVLRRVDSAKA